VTTEQTDKEKENNLAPRNFCQQASQQFEKSLEENMDDPRLVISIATIKESKKKKGEWSATWDARDARP